MATTADFKNGLCIELNGELWSIVEFQHVKPGKGPAFVRTKLRNLRTQRVWENTFTAGVKIDLARVERRPYQFLYKEGDDFIFMNQEDYEQIPLNRELITGVDFLKESDICEVVFDTSTETVLYAELPIKTVLEVTYTEPGEKGNTATNAMKDATVETGATVRVPLFINTGDKIRIDTRTGEYTERVK